MNSVFRWLTGDASRVYLVTVIVVLLIIGAFYHRLVRERKQAQRAIEEVKLAIASQEKLMSDNLQHIQKFEVLGALAGGIAHDFNNVITAILGYTSLIMTDLNVNTTLYRNLMEVHKAGERAVALIAQLMTFSRKKPAAQKVVDLKWVLTDLEHMLRRLMSENIEMEVITDPDLWNVLGDQAQIEQIFVNLVVNARDAMPKGGKLTITASNVVLEKSVIRDLASGEYIQMQVADTGTGIRRENLPHIFEAFFTTKEIGQGTGLGLATVAGLVKRLGGVVSVDTEFGHGTTFTVLLPRELSAVTVVPTVHHKLSRGNETILVVEDELQVRVMLESALFALGYDVISAGSGEQALKVVEVLKDVNLVISDVVMPGLSVQELVGKLREVHPHIRVILISGHLEETIADLLIPNLQVVSKPFNIEYLSTKVREVLDN